MENSKEIVCARTRCKLFSVGPANKRLVKHHFLRRGNMTNASYRRPNSFQVTNSQARGFHEGQKTRRPIRLSDSGRHFFVCSIHWRECRHACLTILLSRPKNDLCASATPSRQTVHSPNHPRPGTRIPGLVQRLTAERHSHSGVPRRNSRRLSHRSVHAAVSICPFYVATPFSAL